jgi:hypothetical protein
MQVVHMVTNGGPHPADKWAEVTANAIVDTILVDSTPDDVSPQALVARAAKRKLRNDLFDILNDHHTAVQNDERATNAKTKKPADAAMRALADPDPRPHMSVMDKVNAAFAATPFSDHFAKPEVQAVTQAIIGQHTASVMNIERRWHHDRLTTKGA